MIGITIMRDNDQEIKGQRLFVSSPTTGARRPGYLRTETPVNENPSADGRERRTIMGLVIRSRRRSR